MKAVVVYDTYFGNTKAVADAIVDQLKAEGNETEIRSVREDYPNPPQGDILFIGTPIRMGGPTGRIKRYVKKLDKAVWSGKPLIVFTTTGMMPKEPATDKQKASFEKWALGGGRKLRDLAKAKGFNAVENYLWVEVKGQEGPLVDTGIEKTKQFTRDVLQSLKK